MPQKPPAQRSRVGSGVVIGVIGLIAAGPLLLGVLTRPESDEPLLVRAGMNLGLLGFGLLAAQFLLSSRMKTIVSHVSFTRALRLHRLTGMAVMILLLLHPLLVSFGEEKPELLNPLRAPIPVLFGHAAFTLLLLHVGLAVWRVRLGMDHNRWLRFHQAAYVIFLLALTHSLSQGDDLERISLRTLWTVYLLGIMALFLYTRILKRSARRHRIADIVRQSHDTNTIILEPENGNCFAYAAGQFMYLKPISSEMPAEEHPFTISSSPAQRDVISATIKRAGDFTQKLDRLKRGDTVLVDGPYGDFSVQMNSKPPCIVFVAAGVGITPFISMLRFARDQNDPTPVLLLFGNRTEEDILFRDELADMQGKLNLRIVHVLSKPSGIWHGENGRIEIAILRRHITYFPAAHFYVCGPAAMMEAVRSDLADLGVDRSRIFWEHFSL
jgi:predicted ferric reductase